MMNVPSKRIVCCGFTPCIQRIIEFNRVEKGAVNRALKVSLGIGGKGANTARMVGQLGGDSLLVGFAGGPNGDLLEQMLNKEGVAFRHIEAEGNTRICQTLVEAGHPETTELVEEMPPILDEEWGRMVELFRLMDLSDSIVAVSGKLPAGAPVDAYAQIAAITELQGGSLVIDAPGEPLLCALEHEPYMVKINDVELLQTIGGEDLIDAALQLIGRGARSVFITRGARSAYYVDELQTQELFPPVIDAINPVGSGDAVTAGICVGLSMDKPLPDLLIDGMACGAANALNLVSGMIKPGDVARLRSQVRMQAM